MELSLLSKERKSHEIHVLGGTYNMKHDTAPIKLARGNLTLSRLQKEKNPQLNLSLEFLESVQLKSCGLRKSSNPLSDLGHSLRIGTCSRIKLWPPLCEKNSNFGVP